jgi:short-chain Z-isoprenyl diphosphate synthase
VLGRLPQARPGVRQVLRTIASPATGLVYRWYEGRLLADVCSHPMPRHVGIILDGNRRFARQHGFTDVSEGHREGARKLREVVGWCNDLQIPAVSVWGLSTDNLSSRGPEELAGIFQTLCSGVDSFREEQGKGQLKRRVRTIGRTELLPAEVRDRLTALQDETAAGGDWLLNLAIAYGGRDEIVDAMKRMLMERAAAGESAADVAGSLSIDALHPYLYAHDAPEPDLIIRTSGEIRLSGFLLWQSVHSELYFCDALWPAFRRIDFLRAIRSYQARHRRFGK